MKAQINQVAIDADQKRQEAAKELAVSQAEAKTLGEQITKLKDELERAKTESKKQLSSYQEVIDTL